MLSDKYSDKFGQPCIIRTPVFIGLSDDRSDKVTSFLRLLQLFLHELLEFFATQVGGEDGAVAVND